MSVKRRDPNYWKVREKCPKCQGGMGAMCAKCQGDVFGMPVPPPRKEGKKLNMTKLRTDFSKVR